MVVPYEHYLNINSKHFRQEQDNKCWDHINSDWLLPTNLSGPIAVVSVLE